MVRGEAWRARWGEGQSRSARRLHARMTPQVDDLARRSIAQFTAEIPTYALLPREEIEGEILDVVRHNLRLFLRCVDDGRQPTRDELAGIVASAARRAEEGVPLADVLAAYHVGARLGWEEMIAVSGPGDVEELLVAAAQLMHYMQSLTSAVSGAYLEVQGTIHGEERAARQELASALLNGDGVGSGSGSLASVASRAGIAVAPSYVVLVVALGTPSEPVALDAGAAIATRRRIRLFQAELDAFAGMPVLVRLDARGGTALLPATPTTADAVAQGVPGLVARLAEVAGSGPAVGGTALHAALHAASAVALRPDDIPAAAGLAGDLVALAVRLGRAAGHYRLDDLLVAYQLTRPGPAREALARKLDAVLDQPLLLQTLRSYLEHERQRLRTAEVLHVHPNTLGYRLGRIAALTGLDPTKHADSQVLHAALTVHDERSS